MNSNNIINIHLKQEIIEGWKTSFLQFQNGTVILKKIVFGRLVNSAPSPNDKENLLLWKRIVAKLVYLNKTPDSHNPEDYHTISLNMKFDPKNNHGGKKLDDEGEKS